MPAHLGRSPAVTTTSPRPPGPSLVSCLVVAVLLLCSPFCCLFGAVWWATYEYDYVVATLDCGPGRRIVATY